MNASTTISLIWNGFTVAIDEGNKRFATMVWSVLMSVLQQYWISIIIFLIVLLILSSIPAFTKHRWGCFASVLYNYLYFGILFIVGLIFGSEIFASAIFDVLAIILYVLCFRMVGTILRKLRLK